MILQLSAIMQVASYLRITLEVGVIVSILLPKENKTLILQVCQ